MDVLGKVFLLSKVAWGPPSRDTWSFAQHTGKLRGMNALLETKRGQRSNHSTSRNHNIAGIPPSRFHRWEIVNSQALSGLCLEKGYTMEILSRW